MRTRSPFYSAVVTLCALLLAALQTGAALAQWTDPIIIGLATAKTGIIASYDGPADAGAALA